MKKIFFRSGKGIKIHQEIEESFTSLYGTLYTLRTTHLLLACVASARAGRTRMLRTYVLPKLIDFASVGWHDVTTRSGHATKPRYRPPDTDARETCLWTAF